MHLQDLRQVGMFACIFTEGIDEVFVLIFCRGCFIQGGFQGCSSVPDGMAQQEDHECSNVFDPVHRVMPCVKVCWPFGPKMNGATSWFNHFPKI
ncbi:MAG: hypothetical protein K9G58_05965 [Bacteroidales bacterium]|nr:hypothetical protein [Bacteroidales bacterium]MCF8397692.1 hypothetical protein [Bacteroidales bacterium]